MSAVLTRMRKPFSGSPRSSTLPQGRVVGRRTNRLDAGSAAYGQRPKPLPDAVFMVGNMASFCKAAAVSVPRKLKAASLLGNIGDMGNARKVTSLTAARSLAIPVGAACKALVRKIAVSSPLA